MFAADCRLRSSREGLLRAFVCGLTLLRERGCLLLEQLSQRQRSIVLKRFAVDRKIHIRIREAEKPRHQIDASPAHLTSMTGHRQRIPTL